MSVPLKSGIIILFLVLAFAVLTAALLAWLRRRRSPPPVLDSMIHEEAGPSLFEIIRRKVEAAGDAPIDDAGFPPVAPFGGERLAFAPGAFDALTGGGERSGEGWRLVLEVIRRVRNGTITDWRLVDSNVRNVPVRAYADRVLERLKNVDITESVYRVFLDLALKSRRHESVKWGIVISGLALKREDVPAMFLLARFPELTPYAAIAILDMSEVYPGYKRDLLKLLPATRSWGVVKLIECLILDRDLVAEWVVQEAILTSGMENNDGLSMEVAFIIAQSIDLKHFIALAREDRRIFRSVFLLFHALMTEPLPLGGLADLQGWPDLLNLHVDLLEAVKPDIHVLASLGALEAFLENAPLHHIERSVLQDRVGRLYQQAWSEDTVVEALRDEKSRGFALALIRKHRTLRLIDEAARLFREDPTDPAVVDTLVSVGDRGHLLLLLESLPSIVDFEKRDRIPKSPSNLFGPDHRNDFAYARIVSSLGRLGTPEAARRLIAAFDDCAPHVRQAACLAAREIRFDLIDEETGRTIRDLVRERLSDDASWVAGEAALCVDKLGIGDL